MMETEIFHALADPTRLRIVERLAKEPELRVSDIADEFALSRQAVTRHLNVLCEAKILETRRSGRERLTRLQPEAFSPIERWLRRYDRFWTTKLEGLKQLVEQEEQR